MAITYNGTNIDKIVYNGVEIFGGPKNVTKTTEKLFPSYLFNTFVNSDLVIGLQLPMKPTKIHACVSQLNAGGGSKAWEFRLKGQTESGSWDELYYERIVVGSKQTHYIDKDFYISSNKFYKNFAYSVFDPVRAFTDKQSYMTITGEIKVGGLVKFLLNCLRGVALCQ